MPPEDPVHRPPPARHVAGGAFDDRAAGEPPARLRQVSRISRPNGTSAGQAVSLTLDALVDDPLERGDAGAARHCTSRMAVMRPRGLAASSPVTRYVGQWGRHNPHWTHAASSSSSTSRGPRSPARESACAACVARDRRAGPLMRPGDAAGVQAPRGVERLLDPAVELGDRRCDGPGGGRLRAVHGADPDLGNEDP